MNKKFLMSFVALAVSGQFVMAQIGINTQTPESTLDIRGKNHLGPVTTGDGILIPRVNSLTAPGNQNGQLVYLIADNGGLFKGFHYWDGGVWTSFGGGGDPTRDA